MTYKINIKGRQNIPFDKLEILELNTSCINVANQILDDEYHESIVVDYECSEQEIQDFISLWNDLPFSEQSRCHLPPYAIRICYQGKVDFVASICWECDNIYISGSANLNSLIEFNGSSAQAQALLTMCKNIFNK